MKKAESNADGSKSGLTYTPACRIFAKPFIAAFPHDDGVTCLARNPRLLNGIVSPCLCSV